MDVLQDRGLTPLRVILGFSLVTAVYGLYQWHQGPRALTEQTTNRTLQRYGAAYTWAAGKSGRVFRAFSTYVTPAAFGTNMMLGLLIALVVICRKGGTRTLRYLAIAAAIVIGSASFCCRNASASPV